jgi:4-amino-4-deoxy-L-arabinose transferase-like glycosyltransferase
MAARDLLVSCSAPLLAAPAASVVAAWSQRAGVTLDAETHAAMAFALALAWLQTGGMVLLTAGVLTLPAALAWIAAGVVLAFAIARKVSLPALRPAHALLLVPLAAYLLMATVPPWDRDEMVYHLAVPREFARAHAWVRPDDNIFASLPLGWESAVSMLYAFGRGGQPLFNPRLLGAWTAGAAALATTGLARALGARSAWIAAPLLLATPTVVEFGSSAYVEPYLLLLLVLALGAAARVVAGESRWLLPAAVAAGLAATVKYTGLAALGMLAFALLVDRPQRVSLASPPVRRAARFLAVALVVACPFYVRNAIQRHNPFFPLGFDLFGGLGWDAVRAEAYWETLRAYGPAEGLEGLTLPVTIFFARDFVHGFEGSIGPVVGLGVAAAAWALRRRGDRPEGERHARIAVAVFAFAFFFFWALSVRQARFFLPVVPPLVAFVAVGVDAFPERGGMVGALALAANVAWGGALYAGLWTRQFTSAWLRGALDEGALLARVLPESYPALRALNTEVPPDGRVWLVWTRGHTYYLDRPYRLDSVFEGWRFEALLDGAPDAGAFVAALRADGITHVLANERFFLRGTSAETERGRTARLRQRFAALLSEGALVEQRRWGTVALWRIASP